MSKIRQLIADGHTEEAIEELEKLLIEKGHPDEFSVTLLKSQFQHWKKDRIRGMEPSEKKLRFIEVSILELAKGAIKITSSGQVDLINLKELKKTIIESNNLFSTIGSELVSSLETRYSQLRARNIDLFFHEGQKYWTSLFKEAKKEILATNLVAPKDFPFNSSQTQQQSEARIKRIMLYRERNNDFNEQLKQLAMSQLSQGGVAEAKWIYKKKLLSSNGVYFNYVQKIGSLDFVIFDRQVLLITRYEPDVENILNSTLCTDPNKIESALKLFHLMWNNSNPY